MPRVKVPRCARLLKLKLQGKEPFLDSKVCISAPRYLPFEAPESSLALLCPRLTGPMPSHAAAHFSYTSAKL